MNKPQLYAAIEQIRWYPGGFGRISAFPQVLGLQAAKDSSDLDARGAAAEVRELANDRSREMFETQLGLNYLAQQTGGFAIRNNNDLNGGIKRILEDQKGY